MKLQGKIRMRLSAFASFLLIQFLPCAGAAGFNPDPEALSAREIMERAVAVAEAQYLSMQEAYFESESVTKNQKLDEDGKITETEILRHRQYPLHGAVFEELLELNGRPLYEEEVKKEGERKEEFIREVEKRRTRGDYLQPEKEQAIRFDAYFASKYDYELVETAVVRSHRCWVIAFAPKDGKLPVRTRMDHALNELTGTLWVSQDDYGLVRVEFAMRKPFRYWGGLLAVIRNTDGMVDYTRGGPGVWLPLHFDLKLDIRIVLLKNIRQRITKDWYEYRRVSGNDGAAEQ
ncbi:MAG: hypothetical protein JW793_11910 [Acidobacteria bacterium]|nr:hypothetical protein [Acidobacteriota bacterium]